MTRKKNHTKDAVLLDALRANLNLLGELAVRYEVETQPERSTGERSSVCSPQDVRRVLQPEMASWPMSNCESCCSTPEPGLSASE